MSLLAAAIGTTAGALGAAGLGRLRENRRATGLGSRALSDLLGWGFLVGEGVVLMKDGSFLAAWRFRGRDLASSTAGEVAALAEHVNAAVASYGDGWMVHVDAVRREAVGYADRERCHFPDPVSALVDETRRARYTATAEHYETDAVLTLTYTPPGALTKRMERAVVQGRGSDGPDWDRLLGRFEREARDLEGRLASALRLERFGSADLLRHLHECLTGLGHAVGVPGHGAYLDYALADQSFVGGFEPRIGGEHVRVVAVQGYPNATRPGLADPLTRLPFPYRWSVRFLPFSPATASKVIGKSQLGWFQKRRGAGDWAKDMASKKKRETTELDLAFQDGNATAMVHDAGAARSANSGGEIRFGYLTVCAVVMADDAREADDRAQAVLKAVRDLGFTGRVEDVNAVDAFVGSLPGHGHANLRRPVLSTENVVDVLPLTAPWGGHREVPSGLFPEGSPPLLWARTDGSTPFRLCLHEGDVGHTLVVGATGAGKSVLVGLILAQWRRYAECADGDVRRRLQPLRLGPRDGRGALRPRGHRRPRRRGHRARSDAAAPRRRPARRRGSGPSTGWRAWSRCRANGSRPTSAAAWRTPSACWPRARPRTGRSRRSWSVSATRGSARSSVRTRWKVRTASSSTPTGTRLHVQTCKRPPTAAVGERAPSGTRWSSSRTWSGCPTACSSPR